MSLLAVSSLRVSYGSVTAVRGGDLDIDAGTVTGVLGSNGAGKTSLLLGIMRAAPTVTGSLVFDGRDLSTSQTRDVVRAGIALCPQNRRLFPAMSIRDNLLIGAQLEPSKVARERLVEAFSRTPWMAKRANEPAGRLSGGQQQLIAIARSLMAGPRLLMLDEPSAGLSPVAVHEIRELLQQIASDGLTVLLVEQNPSLVQHLCSSAYVLADGKIVGHDSVSKLVADDLLSDAYLG